MKLCYIFRSSNLQISSNIQNVPITNVSLEELDKIPSYNITVLFDYLKEGFVKWVNLSKSF